ncbi:MAG: GWxTD domain-containing protein [Candidatus Taylorbacteria bacterium]|nr:GWxTD domain-containing protein [Candidatus Taylorbacteria bacterium]
MRKNLFFAGLIIFSVVALGCAGKRVKVDPNDPVWKHKQEFLLNYGFFVTKKETVSYYQEALGVAGKENEIFDNLTTIEDVDKFIEVFMKVRDPNPNTPENEFRDEKDQRIKDIENEIFAADPDIPGTHFTNNGGLKGDMAHVYLFYGVPSYKARLSEGRNHVELMVWYYLDVQGKPLFRFLFYNNYGSTRLFKKQVPILNPNDLFSPLMSPLKEISNRPVNTPEELYEIWLELEHEDPEWTFRGALLQFSYYSDVHIEDSLRAPEPAALTAERAKPTVLGQPGDLTGREFLNSARHSLIPAELQITKDSRPSFTLGISYPNIDWEIKGENAEFVLDIRISFQNKKTKALREFTARLSYQKPREEVERKRKGVEVNGVSVPITMNIPLDDIQNFARVEKPQQTLRQLVDGLEPGTYVVNVDLRHAVTKKSAGGWREEITIK